MIWHIIRYWISFLLPTFYKRIQIKNADRLKVKGPVIIAMNHPNAFTDPVALTMACYPPRLHYLARGDVFKPGLISWLLESIGIVPIFRIQDGGKEGLKKNDEAYRRVNALLKKNAKIIVFAEGICIQERRLRPLKKGIARMVFGAYEALNHDKLIVVPVGVNYSKPDKFRSNLFYNVGEPIYIKNFIEEYNQNPARANNHFLQVLEPKMKELITHVNDKKNDEAVFFMEKLLKKDMVKEQGLDYHRLENQHLVLKQITELVNRTAIAKQDTLDEFKTKASNYFKHLNEKGFRDWLINPKQNKNVNYFNLLLRSVVLLLGLPIYLLGLFGNLLPLVLTDKLTRKIIKNKEFYSSIALAVSMVLFLSFYVIWFCLGYAIGSSVFYSLSLCAGFMLSGVFSLFYHPFLLKSVSTWRILRNNKLRAGLSKEREDLLYLINKF